MPARATPLLEVDQIEVAYGKARAVNGATVRVAEGSITAIVGPNGAGKTSLAQGRLGATAHPGGTDPLPRRADRRRSPSARSLRSASRTSRKADASSPR